MPLTFIVKITPKAAKYRWKLDKNGSLKCYLISPAIEGRANSEFIKKLAKLLDLPQSAIEIVTGHTTQTKKITIATAMTYDLLLKKLNIITEKDNQIDLF